MNSRAYNKVKSEYSKEKEREGNRKHRDTFQGLNHLFYAPVFTKMKDFY